MANILLEEKDSEGALEIIKYGREFFESDVNLIIAELNYYLGQNDFVKAEKLLTLAVEEDPNNHQLFLFFVGLIYINFLLRCNNMQIFQSLLSLLFF